MAALAYIVSPVDLVPDFIPGLGQIDDLVVLSLGLCVAIRLISPEVWEECRARAEARPE